jgi:cytochrome c oxidase subunit II
VPIQVQAGQFAFYFRYPGPDGKFGPLHADQISEANANFFGLDTTTTRIPKTTSSPRDGHPGEPRDSPADAFEGRGPFLLRPRIARSAGFRPRPGCLGSLHGNEKVGKYEIVCTQLCGLGHYNMKAYLEVKSQEDYDAWIKQQAALQ